MGIIKTVYLYHENQSNEEKLNDLANKDEVLENIAILQKQAQKPIFLILFRIIISLFIILAMCALLYKFSIDWWEDFPKFDLIYLSSLPLTILASLYGLYVGVFALTQTYSLFMLSYYRDTEFLYKMLIEHGKLKRGQILELKQEMDYQVIKFYFSPEDNPQKKIAGIYNTKSKEPIEGIEYVMIYYWRFVYIIL